jgi:hypothetical protein
VSAAGNNLNEDGRRKAVPLRCNGSERTPDAAPLFNYSSCIPAFLIQISGYKTSVLAQGRFSDNPRSQGEKPKFLTANETLT